MTFKNQYAKLTKAQRAAVRAALKDFIKGCDSDDFSASLRVHKIESKGVWSMTWAGDGRALFTYGDAKIVGKRHVKWLSIGTHAVYKD